MGFFELLEGVAKLGRFDDSTRCIGLGEKEQNHALALEVLQPNGFPGI
jgi:hypothetical protein